MSRSGLRHLYKDRENGVIMGVCAGIADHFDIRVSVLRLIALICLLFFFVPTLVVYITAGLLLRDRPLSYCGRDPESKFWRSPRHRGDTGEAN